MNCFCETLINWVYGRHGDDNSARRCCHYLHSFSFFFPKLLCPRCFTEAPQSTHLIQILFKSEWNFLDEYVERQNTFSWTRAECIFSIYPLLKVVFLLWFLSFVWLFWFFFFFHHLLPSQRRTWKNHLDVKGFVRRLVLFQVSLWVASRVVNPQCGLQCSLMADV